MMIGVISAQIFGLGNVALDQGTGVKIDGAHYSPRSSMTISEADLPGARPNRSANRRRSSADTGSGGIGPWGRGRIMPFATNRRYTVWSVATINITINIEHINIVVHPNVGFKP